MNTAEPGTDCGPEQEGQGRCGSDGLLEVCKGGYFVVGAQCGFADQCSAARAVCLDCAPGSFRCSGDALERCNLEGSAFEVVRTCDSGAACVADGMSGHCVVCSAETAACDAFTLEFPTNVRQVERPVRPNASLRVCNADGARTREVETCDLRSAVCDPSSLRCLACDAGTISCVGSELLRCAADGSRLELLADCGHAARCDAAAARCFEAGCADGAGARLPTGTVRCRGSNQTELSICGASGGWEILDLCDSALACSSGIRPRRCLDDAAGYCIPGASRCVGDTVQRCADFEAPGSPEVEGGTWYHYAHCTNECVTRPDGSADCDRPAGEAPYTDSSVCEPGTRTFLSCAAGACVESECPNGLVCAGSSSGCQLCAPDKVRCDGNVLKACNMTGTAESVLEDCGAGVCDSFRQKCLPVAPGERLCVAGDLQRVSVEGTVQTIASCGAQALCDPAAGCRPAACVVGSVLCDGAAVLSCSDGLELTPTARRCESAARCENGLGCARARRVAAGEAHTCALIVAEDAPSDALGYVQCWGANESGQLGNGSSSFGDEPEARHVVTRLAKAVPTAVPTFRSSGLCAGRDFSCADVTLATGAPGVACWGANDKGQLGIGSALPGVPLASHFNAIVAPVSAGLDASPRDGVPDPLVALSGVTCGADFACALDADAKAWCWGANDAGQLGGAPSRTPSLKAELVLHQHSFVNIVAGARHVCALDRENGLWCWGDGAKGQLGLVDSRAVAGPALLRNVTATEVALGRDFSLVRGFEGDATLAFGDNFFGQLSTGTHLPSVLPIATQGLESERVSAVWSGPTAAHACALVRGSLACWGANALGQLGDGSLTDRYRPVVAIDGRVTELLGQRGSVALGERHTCAIDAAGGIWCWGSNQRAELGDGFSVVRSSTPVRVY